MSSSLHFSRTYYLSDGELKNREIQVLNSNSRPVELWPDAEAWNGWQKENALRPVKLLCNALIDRLDLPETDQLASQLARRGYACAKIKVGTALDLERARIENVKLQIPRVRVDANRSLTLPEAETLFDDLEIDYAEEPLRPSNSSLRTLEELEEFSMRTCVSYALDETLAELNPEEVPRLDGLKALVLKPHRLGGKLQSWFDWAKAHDKSVVISHMFDSPVGLHHLACLAESIAGFHGLDPSYLKDNPFVFKEGQWLFQPQATFSWLQAHSKDNG